jgi:hypothetical protein
MRLCSTCFAVKEKRTRNSECVGTGRWPAGRPPGLDRTRPSRPLGVWRCRLARTPRCSPGRSSSARGQCRASHGRAVYHHRGTEAVRRRDGCVTRGSCEMAAAACRRESMATPASVPFCFGLALLEIVKLQTLEYNSKIPKYKSCRAIIGVYFHKVQPMFW